MRRLAPLLAASIPLLAPFGEGGRMPAVLLALQTIVLVSVVLAGALPNDARPRGAGPLAGPGHRLRLGATVGLVLLLASALRASYPLAAALGLRDLLAPFLLAWAASRLAGGARGLDGVVVAVVASTTFQALLALARYPGGGAAAAGSSFVNPSHLAAFLGLGFFLVLPRLLLPAARRVRIAWGGLAALHFVTILLLESRGALAALFVALVVAALLRGRALPERTRRIALGLLAAGGIAALLVLGARFTRADDPYRYTRLSIWKAAATMIGTRPGLGFGPGMFPYVSKSFNFPAAVGPVRYGRDFQGAHSAWLGLAAECGLPVAALILAALSAAVLAALRAPLDEPARFGIGLAVLALAVQGCVEDVLMRPALTLVPALLLGAAAAARRTRDGEAVPSPQGPARRGWSLHPASAAAATLVVHTFVVAILLPYLAAREASAALRLGKEGLPRMERASRLNPLQPDYRNDLAMAILNSGPLTAEGYARAATLLVEARRLDPNDYRFTMHLARLEARGAASLFDDPTAGDRALALYREAVRLTPLDPRPRLELASHFVDLKRPEEALPVLEEALVIEPVFVRARLLQASILLEIGRQGEARESLRAAERTLADLRTYVPDSSYARDITLDAQAERERLAGVLGEKDARSSRS